MAKKTTYKVVIHAFSDEDQKGRNFTGEDGSIAHKMHDFKGWNDSVSTFARIAGNDGIAVIPKHDIKCIVATKTTK